jgi:hypothetical protein
MERQQRTDEIVEYKTVVRYGDAYTLYFVHMYGNQKVGICIAKLGDSRS